MKRFGVPVSLALFLLFAFTFAVMAQSGGTGTVLKDANLRVGPGTTYAIAGKAKAGDAITIIDMNAAGDWYQVTDSQWIAAFLVEVAPVTTTITTTVTSTVTTPSEGASAAQAANLRAGPSTTSAIVGKVTKGQALSLVGRTAASDWYKLLEDQWIAASLVINAPTTLPVVSTTATGTATPKPATTPTKASATVAATPTTAPAQPTAAPTIAAPTTVPATATSAAVANCEPSYPTLCLPPTSANTLNCGDIDDKRFPVLQPDPHGFDGDEDGIGCES